MAKLQLKVNGKAHTLDVPDNRYLAEVLRYDLGLTGTKIGCNEAECGICTVLVDGVPVSVAFVLCSLTAFPSILASIRL
jgi:aerobic-type carbon monoxide dehydrogenase small subunit (CoxS/CutS family)